MRPPTSHCDFIKNYDNKTFESTITTNRDIETIKLLATKRINS